MTSNYDLNMVARIWFMEKDNNKKESKLEKKLKPGLTLSELLQ
jgi:hypothetical protein